MRRSPESKLLRRLTPDSRRSYGRGTRLQAKSGRLGTREPRAAQVPRWLGTGEAVTVGAYLLQDAMVYISEFKPRKDEPSCIDLSLPVGKPVKEAAGSLGYYPTYARLSPGQRANYLRWLSSGRVEPLHDIGYAFLFFYGLERRLLVERQDLSRIVKEVVRLLETYTSQGSFDGYLSRFLAFTLARDRNRDSEGQVV